MQKLFVTKNKLLSGIFKLTIYNSKNCDFEKFQEYFQCFTLCKEIPELGGYISILIYQFGKGKYI